MFEYEGTVSEGTMRQEDLIPKFLDVLEKLDVKGQYQHVVDTMTGNAIFKSYYGSDDAAWDLDELFDLLNVYAPEGFYFGSHPGDGADYGFWKVEEECSG